MDFGFKYEESEDIISGFIKTSEERRVNYKDSTKIIQVRNKKHILMKGHTSNISCMCMSSDKKFIITGSLAGEIKLWHLPSLKQSFLLPSFPYAISLIAITPDSVYILFLYTSTSITIFNLYQNRYHGSLNGHSSNITSIKTTSDSKLAITSSNDSTIRIWSIEYQNCVNVIFADKCPVNCIFIKSNNIIISGSRGSDYKEFSNSFESNSIKIWNFKECDGEMVLEINGLKKHVVDVAADEKFSLVFALVADYSVRFWKFPSGEADGIIMLKHFLYRHLRVCPKSSILAISCKIHIALYSLENKSAIKEIHVKSSNSINDFSFLPCNSTIVILTLQGVCYIYDYFTNQYLNEFLLENYDLYKTIELSPALLMSHSDESFIIRLWDLSKKKQICYYPSYDTYLISFKATISGKYLLCAYTSLSFKLWKIPSV